MKLTIFNIEINFLHHLQPSSAMKPYPQPFFQTVCTAVIFMISLATVSGQAWTVLGSCKVNGNRDYDEITVTASRGDFKAVKLAVENEGIEFNRVVVHYGNGTSDRLDIRKFIPAGGETRVLDLAGGDRVVRKVSFYYEGNPMTFKKGKVVLYGRR